MTLLLFLAAGAGPLHAQDSAGASARELVVGTRDAPPFAMKDAQGNWEGISIDLWRHEAEQLHLRYRIEQFTTVQLSTPAAPGTILDLRIIGHDGRQLLAG